MRKWSCCLVLLACGCGVGGRGIDASRPRDTGLPSVDLGLLDTGAAADTGPPVDVGPPPPDAWTPPASREAVLTAGDAQAGDHLGTSVALSADGTRALVGAYTDATTGGIPSGGARVFVRAGTSWTEEAALEASDAAANDRLGYSVALSGDGSIALVGAPLDDTSAATDAGSVRVFVRSATTWTEQTTLLAPDGVMGDGFGTSVGISRDGMRAIVGAFHDDTVVGVDAGTAHVYVRSGTTWTREGTLRATSGGAGDALGTSVALSGDGSVAIAGAPGGGIGGAAYVFLRTGTTWAEQAQLLGTVAGGQLGVAVALSDDGARALAGAPREASNAGAGHLFVRSGTSWSTETTLSPSGASPGDGNGASVALSTDGGRALLGAPDDDRVASVDTGSARVFELRGTAWTETETLLAPDAAPGDALGVSVALAGDGTRALLGALADETPAGAAAGSAQVFVLP